MKLKTKNYRQFVNGRQTKEERKFKYHLISILYGWKQAMRLRDFTWNHVKLIIKYNNYFEINENSN